MFWSKKMSAQDIETLVDKAVQKATSKSEEAMREERRCSNYLKASQSGQFRTRSGIYEYFRAYEGMSAKDALDATELECQGRGIGESGKVDEPETQPSVIKQIQDEAMGAVLNSLKNDPMGTLQTVGQVVGGVATFGAGLIGGKAIADSQDNNNTQQLPSTPQEELPTEVISADDLD